MAARELNEKAPRADAWCAFAARAVVDNRGPMEGECVRWGSFITQAGYPEVKIAGKRHPAHRLVAALFYGPAALRGKDVHHTCEVPDCTNPLHLLPVTPSEHGAIHQGVEGPPFPPPFTGDLDADAVIAVMKAFSKKPRRTRAQMRQRERTMRLVLNGLLFNLKPRRASRSEAA